MDILITINPDKIANHTIASKNFTLTPNDCGKLECLPTTHTNQLPKTYNDLQQSNLDTLANYSLTTSPIVSYCNNTSQYGIDLFSIKLINDSTNRLLSNINYRWFHLTQANSIAVNSKQKFKFKKIFQTKINKNYT